MLYFNQDSAKIFPNTQIKGGIAVLHYNRSEEIGPIGTFTSYQELNDIVKKVVGDNFQNLGEILFSNTSYKYSPILWEEHPELKDRVSGGSKRYLSSSVFDKLNEIFFENKPNDNHEYIQILGRQNNERIFKWIRKDYLINHPNLNFYKVLVPSSNGTGKLGETLSTPLIETPQQGHTETFISFGIFSNKRDADNLLKYIKTKFLRAMLGVVKITQGNKTREVWSKVPLQDFTADSDIDWTKSISDIDNQLYKKYDLSDEEITFIEDKVKLMD